MCEGGYGYFTPLRRGDHYDGYSFNFIFLGMSLLAFIEN